MNVRWIPLLMVCGGALLTAGCDGGPTGGEGGADRQVACTGDSQVPIGGAFTLVDHRGDTVTEDVLAGRHSLIYFGFTHCPDVCPTELSRMTQALDLIEDGRDGGLTGLKPVFVTVDPARDTVDVMANYISLFHPAFVGLTGTEDQIAKAADTFNIYYSIPDDRAGGDYNVDHASMIYFLGPEGHYITHFTRDDSPEAIAERVRPCL